MAPGVDVGGDADNGGSQSEDGGELHFDRDSMVVFGQNSMMWECLFIGNEEVLRVGA